MEGASREDAPSGTYDHVFILRLDMQLLGADLECLLKADGPANGVSNSDEFCYFPGRERPALSPRFLGARRGDSAGYLPCAVKTRFLVTMGDLYPAQLLSSAGEDRPPADRSINYQGIEDIWGREQDGACMAKWGLRKMSAELFFQHPQDGGMRHNHSRDEIKEHCYIPRTRSAAFDEGAG